jgi:hypothetical protein
MPSGNPGNQTWLAGKSIISFDGFRSYTSLFIWGFASHV